MYEDILSRFEKATQEIASVDCKREDEHKELALRRARAEAEKAEHEARLTRAQAMLAEAELELKMAQVHSVRDIRREDEEDTVDGWISSAAPRGLPNVAF